MKATLPNLKKLAGRGKVATAGNSDPLELEDIEPTEAAEPKPPPPLSLFFMLSHLEDDGPVRLDGVKLGVLEVMGLELDEPKLGAFAGSLNALDFPVQLLVRQHPPVLATLRKNLYRGPAQRPSPTNEGGRRLPGTAVDRSGIPRGHPGPAFLRRLRARPDGRTAGPAGPGRIGSVPPERPGPAAVAAGLGPGRLTYGQR